MRLGIGDEVGVNKGRPFFYYFVQFLFHFYTIFTHFSFPLDVIYMHIYTYANIRLCVCVFVSVCAAIYR